MTKIIRRTDGYWIVELPMNTPDCGPYDRKDGPDSAKEDLEGLTKFFTTELVQWYAPKKKLKVRVRKLS